MLPEAVRLAYDGMALICNNQNLDSCISVKDVKNILLGKKTKWNEVNPGSKLGEIWVCFDNRKSSAVNYCCDSILGGKPINSPNVFAAKNSKDVIDYVAERHRRNRQQLAQRQARLYQHHMEQGYPRDVCLEARPCYSHELMETLPGLAAQRTLPVRAYHLGTAQRPEARLAVGLRPLHRVAQGSAHPLQGWSAPLTR